MRRWLKRMLWAGLVTLVLVSLGIFSLLNSRAGAQWTIDRLVAVSGVEITYAPVEGNLRRGLSVPWLRYQDDERLVELDRLEFAINWPELTLARVALGEIYAKEIRHQEFGSEASGEPLQIALPQWSFKLCVEQFNADTLISGAGESATIITDLSLANACIDGQDHRLAVAEASLQTQGVSARARQIEAAVSGQVPLTATLNWEYPEQGWSGSGPVGGRLDLLELEQNIDGPYPFTAIGTVAPFEDPDLVVDIRAAWQTWQVEDLSLKSGNAHLVGALEDYTLAFSFTAVMPDVPELEVAGSGTGNLGGLEQVEADADSAIGGARYRGRVDWREEVESSGLLTLNEFDPAWIHDSLSGSLGGTADTVLDGDGRVGFENITMTGRLNGQPMKLEGAADIQNGLVHCRSCRLLAGDNEIRFDGSVDGDQVNAALAIRAPALHMILPDLTGRINAEGTLAGALTSPVFTGRAGGTGLAYGGWYLGRLSINSGSVSTDEVRFSLLAEDLAYEESPPAKVTVEAAGRLNALDVDLQWASAWLNADVRAGLSVNGDAVNGRIRSARLSEPFSGAWRLESPFEVIVDPSGLSAGSHRWLNEQEGHGDGGEIEVRSFSVEGGATAVNASLSHWPLQALDSILPPTQRLSGHADAEMNVSYREGAWEGSVYWRQANTILVAKLPGDDEATIQMPQAWLEAELIDGGAKVSVRVDIEPDVTAALKISADRVSTEANITGDLALSGSDWSWVSSVVPDIDRLEGRVSADLGISGPLLAPAIKGRLDWQNGKLMIPVLNVLFEEIGLSIEGEPNGAASFSGSAQAGEGKLAVEGRLENIMTPERSVSIKLTGDAAQLLNWPEYQAWVSPEIEVSSGADGWELSGVIALPRAEVKLRELPEDAVTVSEDVKVIGEEEAATRPTRYFGEAQLILGEQVRVQLFGLDTRLQGSLLLRQPRGRPPTATGEVTLVGGTFEAYGQKLKIEQGTLLFTGPLDNPVVDVKATRVIETFDGTVTAGIHLQGRALNLSSRAYSDPAMAEADALSYLVIGRPLSQASDAESLDVSKAAIALSLAQASKVTQQIGNRLGLDQLSLVGDGSEGTALVAGKQINKRLFARYAYGVFSRLGSLLLRYKLSRRVAIEAASGERQSLDILYTVEKY